MKKIGVIGCGPWGMKLVRVFRELGVLKAVCDKDQTKLLDIKDTGILLSLDYPSLLQRDLDGIVIATPAETHYRIARDALVAGKDVLVEKPMTLDCIEARDLVSLAKNQILMVGHVLLYHPTIQRIKQNLKDLGTITHIISTRLNWGRFRDYENCWWSFAPHDISVILYLLDKMPIRYRVHGDQNCTQTLLEFGGGERAYIQVSWLYPTKMHRLVVVGDKGKIEFDGLKPTIPEPLKEEAKHFIECIETRKKPLTDGKHGLRVIKVLERCDSKMKHQNGLHV